MIEVYDYEGFVRALAVLVPAVWVWIGILQLGVAAYDDKDDPSRWPRIAANVAAIVLGMAGVTSALISWHLAAQSGATI